MDEHLITAEEVAQLLSVKPQTVRDAAWRGKLPCVRLWTGRRKTLLRFKKSEIAAFVQERSTGCPRDPAQKKETGRASR